MDKCGNVYSQFGEDRIIESIFSQLTPQNRWCFEVGAHDGKWFSNTKHLRDQGWFAVLVEADEQLRDALNEVKDDRVRCVIATAAPSNLDDLLIDNGCPMNPDLGSIDIDGQEYWVWDGMERVRPRVLIIEVADRQPGYFVPEIGGEGQATREAIHRLAVEKEYRCVAETRVNCVFVDEKDTECSLLPRQNV